jgi:hypothetical protein
MMLFINSLEWNLVVVMTTIIVLNLVLIVELSYYAILYVGV